MDFRNIESQITNVIGLTKRPVAVSFVAQPPAGVKRYDAMAPSGCTFWKLAAEGRTFYTEQAHHYNCAVGCYTHSIALPPERAQELPDTINLMASIGYIKPEEVAGIHHLAQPPGAVVYAPLGDAPVAPDVVLCIGQPGRLMLLQEAGIRAGVGSGSSLLGRPTCASLPASLAQGIVVSSACVGNRVYTDLAEDELYIAIPGKDIARVAQELETIVSANRKLTDYHTQRKAALSAHP
ncbi:MAG TPA: DUF169 domain-containing protein [Terriglobales bacterium]|nr:DUF169 domain-containing protein [Terriglobales bacterium]